MLENGDAKDGGMHTEATCYTNKVDATNIQQQQFICMCVCHYTYMYMYMYVCICTYIYIYI